MVGFPSLMGAESRGVGVDVVVALIQTKNGISCLCVATPRGPRPRICPLDSMALPVHPPAWPLGHTPVSGAISMLTSLPRPVSAPACPTDLSPQLQMGARLQTLQRHVFPGQGPRGKDRSLPSPTAWPPRAWGAFPEDTPLSQPLP